MRRPNHSILKEIRSEYALERLILNLKLQYFGHFRQRVDSFGSCFDFPVSVGALPGRRP